jgi:FtsP/CotA-like multicopper oxidase with cupredoxin domain
VHVQNQGDLDTTVHWHGLRLENRYDGVPHETQAPIPVGGEFTYRIQLPDAGLYWYHPHIREDYTQELGLYGNLLVIPSDPDYWSPVDRELVLTVDDLLVEEDGRIAPFSPTETSYAAMGRFGNVFLVGGQPDPVLEARAGEVVRLWLTSTANTRVFNVAVPGARLKLVGGDSGRYEREEFVEGVVLAPSERAVVDVLVERPGELRLEHHTPNRVDRLATMTVATDRVVSPAAGQFERLRRAPELEAERGPLDRCAAAMDDHGGHAAGHGQGHGHDHGGHGEGHGTADGIEWEDDMVEVNRLTTTATMHWRFLDRTSGADSPAIDWHFTVGDRVKLRLINEMDSDIPCTTPSTSTAPAGSWCCPAMAFLSRIWCGRTRCWSGPARSWTSCSTSVIPGCGWPTATSPSTCRAA